MYRLFCTLVVMVLLVGGGKPCLAEPIEAPNLNLPNVQGGMIYSVDRDKLEGCTTATVLSYPTKIGDFELRAGYAIESTPIGALCFKVGDLTQYGFKQPLLGLLDLSIGAYVGYDFRDNGGWDYGVVATIISIKF